MNRPFNILTLENYILFGLINYSRGILINCSCYCLWQGFIECFHCLIIYYVFIYIPNDTFGERVQSIIRAIFFVLFCYVKVFFLHTNSLFGIVDNNTVVLSRLFIHKLFSVLMQVYQWRWRIIWIIVYLNSTLISR